MTAQLLRSRTWDDCDLLELAGTGAGCLSLARTDIDFRNLTPNYVTIDIKLTNSSDERSPAQPVMLQAAPLGAFVPWRPLTALVVPSLAPGQDCRLQTTALVARPARLGTPGRVPPRQLLTALGIGDDRPDKPAAKLRSRPAQGWQPLPEDLMQMLLQETPHWAGNINVLMSDKAVERHVAKELRIYPGRVNMAWFFVGAGGQDAYAFHLEGLAEDWHATLFDMTDRDSLVLDPRDNTGLAEERWIPTDGTRIVMLALKVPAACQAGAVEVHVRQKSTGREAVVEFSLDPRAAGKGCYVV